MRLLIFSLHPTPGCQEEDEEKVRPRVPFSACLEGWGADSIVEDYHSAAAGKKVVVSALTAILLRHGAAWQNCECPCWGGRILSSLTS